ncbi:hypothetical protein Scep_011184 [Stephania cephalantha]|uniref:Bromo domain-containing protein n=1 Tax=Stephania cephalantha TaxID=152367 RepID=A0AAP0JEG1_9MAGN
MMWGTWEELVLGGAVLRHGVRDWVAVAEELRCRTFCPHIFTAKTCKAKYEDLQERYFGCNAWFEELRKRRVAELKRELEKSEDSIGSLESKLESLKGAKRSFTIANLTESPTSIGNSDGFELSSKDGLSAGSFTEGTRTNWSSKSQIPMATTTTTTTTKTTTKVDQIMGSNVKKRRGKRKRKDCNKDCNEIKEGSIGDSRVVVEDYEGIDEDLLRVLNLIEKNEHGSIFPRRLDHDQRKARYKRTIRRHMDLDTIRSRISHRTIVSSRELHRDLLLLCNNALVFYPKHSREHGSAALLRKFVNRTFQKKLPEPPGTDEVSQAVAAVKNVERSGGGDGEKGKKENPHNVKIYERKPK